VATALREGGTKRAPNGSSELPTNGAAQALNGDQPAGPDRTAERLFEDYSGRIYRYCLARLGSPEEAEDALQGTYLNAWRSLKGGVRPREPRPWLFQIASNVCSTVLRSRLRGAKVELRSPDALDYVGSSRDPGDELLGLSAALEALPERQRHALLLRDWRGLSYNEIAAELDVSYAAVETLLFRARQGVATFLVKPPRRTRSARVREAVSALLPLPPALSGLKSALAGGLTPAKVAVGIALGATAPLIAFGLVEGAVERASGSRAESTAPTSDGWRPPFVAATTSSSGVSEPLRGRLESKRQGRTAAPVTRSAAGGAAASVAGPTPGPPTPADPVPTGPNPPPAKETAGAALVVICHRTGSAKNPGVTISVAAAAVEAYLAGRDQLGPCPT
jgi:RNA polymerase sigma-70 factor, ECF subfamily